MDVDAILHGFDPTLPLADARCPPPEAYSSDAIAARERATLFRRRWLCAGRAERVAMPGAWCVEDVAGHPILLARDDAGELRAFHATCRHRATVIAEGCGHGGPLRCPYHGWVYGLDGALRAAPRAGAVDKATHGLRPVRVGVWRRWVFVHLGEPDEALADVLAPVDAVLDDAGLVHVSTRVWRVEASWKVVVDNYLDGGYHVPVAHPGLARELVLGSYTTEVAGSTVLQRSRARGGDRLGAEAVYAWVYPTFMLNRYGPVLDTNLVRPISPRACEVVFEHFVTPEVAADAAAVAAFVEASDAVQREDEVLCARVQRGLEAGSAPPGPYAEPEVGALHFHRRWWADLATSPAGSR